MTELHLVAVDEEGTHLLLRRDGEDGDLRLRIDDRLHAAVRGDRARLGQLQIEEESQLRPREIQARVRAGESVEAVAAAAGVGLERVLRFARPVLAEREHIADRARRLPVRRPGSGGPPSLLDDIVESYVAGHDGRDVPVAWDAWRREDGRWTVTATWTDGGTRRSARWVFDSAGRSVTPDDDAARMISPSQAPQPPVLADSAPDSTPAPEPRRAPALAMVPPAATLDDEAATQPIPTVHPDVAAEAGKVDAGAVHPADPPRPDHTARPARTAKSRARGTGRPQPRPSVPSWDEILFGRRQRAAD